MQSISSRIFAVFFCVAAAACTSADRRTAANNEGTAAPANQAAVQVSRPGIKASEPALAAASDGTSYAVWVEHGRSRDADVFVRAFDADGNALSEQVRVNPVPGQAAAWYGDPPTILIGGGKIYIGWTAKFENAPAPANTLYLSVSSDGGKTFASPVKVNDDSGPASHGMHSMALGKDGQVYFAWLDERYLKNKSVPVHAQMTGGHGAFAIRADHTPEPVAASAEPDAELYFAVWNGGASFGANKRLAEHVCPCCKTSIIAAGDGAIYIGFRKVFPGGFRHIAVVSSRDAASFGEPVQVSDDQWQINACPVSGPALRLDGSGRLTAAWYTEGTGGQKGLYLSHSDNRGATFSPRLLIDAEAAAGTPVLTENHLIWNRGGRFTAFRLDSTQRPTSDPALFSDGEHAAAAESQGRVQILVSKKAGGPESIWLSRPPDPEKPERLDVHVYN